MGFEPLMISAYTVFASQHSSLLVLGRLISE